MPWPRLPLPTGVEGGGGQDRAVSVRGAPTYRGARDTRGPLSPRHSGEACRARGVSAVHTKAAWLARQAWDARRARGSGEATRTLHRETDTGPHPRPRGYLLHRCQRTSAESSPNPSTHPKRLQVTPKARSFHVDEGLWARQRPEALAGQRPQPCPCLARSAPGSCRSGEGATYQSVVSEWRSWWPWRSLGSWRSPRPNPRVPLEQKARLSHGGHKAPRGSSNGDTTHLFALGAHVSWSPRETLWPGFTLEDKSRTHEGPMHPGHRPAERGPSQRIQDHRVTHPSYQQCPPATPQRAAPGCQCVCATHEGLHVHTCVPCSHIHDDAHTCDMSLQHMGSAVHVCCTVMCVMWGGGQGAWQQ